MTANRADHLIVASSPESKPDSQSTPGDLRLQQSPPCPPVIGGPGRGDISDTATVARDESNVERGRARVRRLLVEEDSGVRLASGRSGDSALGEDTGSGEWEVLPPPYQEF